MQKSEVLYRAGNSCLHRLDPRLKLIFTGALVAALFSSFEPLRLGVLAGIWCLGAILARQSVAHLWRIVRLLKWLLLFSLFVHLFFTPGQTLWGLRWLSLDGLINGLCVDAQILLAVLFSLLISTTTTAEDLSHALVSILSPLRLLKVPVAEIGAMFLLVLQFFPILKDEMAPLRPDRKNSKQPLLERVKSWSEHLELVLLRLLDHGDRLADDLVGQGSSDSVSVPRVEPLTRHALLVLVCGLGAISLLWWL